MVKDLMLRPTQTKQVKKTKKVKPKALKQPIAVKPVPKTQKPTKKHNKLRIANIILASVMTVIFGGLFIITIITNMFPIKWLLIAGAAVLCVVLLSLIFSIRKKTKKWVRIALCVFDSLFIIVGVVVGYFLITTVLFMNQLNTGAYKKEVFDAVVLKDSSYQDVKDLQGKTVGMLTEKTPAYEQAIEKLHNLITTEDKSDYKDYFELGQAMIDHKLESMLIPDTRYAILKEFDKENTEKTRILYQIEVWIPVEQNVDDVDVTTTPFNVLISGVDTYGDISLTARSDVNMVATVNPKTHKILLTSIPRDYYVQLHGTTGVKDKLTHAGVYGIDMSVNTIEDLLGININYYIRINFSSLVGIVDAIGGIDINSDAAFTAKADKSCHIVQGKQHLDGKCALAYSRERKSYSSGDRHRLLNQQQVLDAIIKKTTSSTVLLTRYSDILGSLSSSFQTNMSQNRIYSLVNYQLDQMPDWTVETYSLDGKGDMQPTYSMGAQLLYVMIPDQGTVDQAKDKIVHAIDGDHK